MNPVTRTNLLLALLVLALGLVAAFEPGLQEEALPTLTNLKPKAINRVELHHRGQLKLLLSRNGQNWEMLQPGRASADNTKVHKLLEFATLPSLHQFPVPQDRLEEFGLVESGYRLQLNQTAIHLGKTDPVTRGRYALTGNRIHLVPDTLYQYLLAPPETVLE